MKQQQQNRAKEEELRKKPLRKPGKARETLTDEPEFAGRHPSVPEGGGPDIVKPGGGGQAEGQTSRS